MNIILKERSLSLTYMYTLRLSLAAFSFTHDKEGERINQMNQNNPAQSLDDQEARYKIARNLGSSFRWSFTHEIKGIESGYILAIELQCASYICTWIYLRRLNETVHKR